MNLKRGDSKMAAALITGVAQGNIGHAAASRLAQDGMGLVITDMRDGVMEVAEQLARDHGVECHAIAGDLGQEKFRQELFAMAFTKFTDMRFLVNCAAISRPTKPLDITVDEWRAVYMINTETTFFCCQTFIRALLAHDKPGAIVNLSSIAGHSGGVNNGIHYGSSKAAIMAMTRGLARAFGKNGIRINCVAPGVIDTAMARAVPGSDDRVKASPLGRWGERAEVADTIAYLLSEQASYMTGQTMDVNGGMT